MPDVLPSCFGDYNGVGPAASARSTQNMVTSLYRTKIYGEHRVISVTWCKSLMGQGLCISIDHHVTCTVDMKPWLFWKKQGSKVLDFEDRKVLVCWDLSAAKFDHGPEPHESYYLSVCCDDEILLLIGDLRKEAIKKAPKQDMVIREARLLSRKEHVHGKQVYTTKSQLSELGQAHEISIECHTDRLAVRVDRQVMVQVKRLTWKFRGNQTIIVDGNPVEVFWDVHNWLFSSSSHGHAVFMFQTASRNEKPWLREFSTTVSPFMHSHGSLGFNCTPKSASIHQDDMCSSVVQWPYHNSSFKSKDLFLSSAGFSLLLYAWKND